MLTQILIASIAALSLSAPATPADAAGKTATAKAEKSAHAAKEPLYCMNNELLVGSRIQKQTCMTRSDWAKEGVNVDRSERG
jgi:hypothetical protein